MRDMGLVFKKAGGLFVFADRAIEGIENAGQDFCDERAEFAKAGARRLIHIDEIKACAEGFVDHRFILMTVKLRRDDAIYELINFQNCLITAHLLSSSMQIGGTKEEQIKTLSKISYKKLTLCN